MKNIILINLFFINLVFSYDLDTNWVIYNTTNSGLTSEIVFSVSIDSFDNKWITGDGYGIVKYDGINWTTYISELPDNK